MIYNSSHAWLNIDDLPDDFKKFGQGLQYFAQCFLEIKDLVTGLSVGNLDARLPSSNNEMAAPLKSLHASLKHLTWQTQQVAKGDYNQRVEFMGDFSTAFNSMVEQLDQQRSALLTEIKHSRRMMQELERSNSLFKIIAKEISQWIVMIDRESKQTLFESRPVDSILANENYEPQLFDWLINKAGEVAVEDEPGHAELTLSHQDDVQYFSATIYPLHWYGHNAAAFVLTDISAEKEHIQNLEEAAYHDVLTKVFNRRYGMKLLNKWIEEKRAFIICFVDIDNLKYVNDKFGHTEGDRYILTIVNALLDFSPKAIVCRLGGDEFMILSQNRTKNEGDEKLEELRTILLQFNSESDFRYNHSMSYGVVEVPKTNVLTAKDLLFIADERMYAYKRTHKAQRAAIALETID